MKSGCMKFLTESIQELWNVVQLTAKVVKVITTWIMNLISHCWFSKLYIPHQYQHANAMIASMFFFRPPLTSLIWIFTKYMTAFLISWYNNCICAPHPIQWLYSWSFLDPLFHSFFLINNTHSVWKYRLFQFICPFFNTKKFNLFFQHCPSVLIFAIAPHFLEC